MGLESGIQATTGFQNRVYRSKGQLKSVLEAVIKSETKEIEYVQTSLRSAKEIYKDGGNVTLKYRDQLFRMHYDNRRVLQWESSIPSHIENLVDSKPIESVVECGNMRSIGRQLKTRMYSRYGGDIGQKNKYKDKLEIVLRNFVKGLETSPPLFNLPPNAFSRDADVVSYLCEYTRRVGAVCKITGKRVSKYRLRSVKIGKIAKTKESEDFIRYVLEKFPSFDSSEFFIK